MKYIGIDVGKNKYFIVWYDDTRKINNKDGSFAHPKEVYGFLQKKTDCVVAIDAPSGYCDDKNERRVCEEELGIGGYFKTPHCSENEKPWMTSGFQLWKHLQEITRLKRAKYFKKNECKPVVEDHLIEVHPTIIFKKLENSKETNSKKWIGCRKPINKKRSAGKKQRREKLHLLFPNQKSIIDNLKIDYIDALIAAYTAEQASKGNVIAFGDPNEGQIWFPNN